MKYVYILTACWGALLAIVAPEQPMSILLSILGAGVIFNTYILVRIILNYPLDKI